ncbi:hypothetical protein RB2150_13471 [Rhodobacteraceae bacterium HTCC2150]|nr:hypothetical protein RB2150_13471 [Rhodobacteraceae bacterium HTCC2150]
MWLLLLFQRPPDRDPVTFLLLWSDLPSALGLPPTSAPAP